MLATSRHGFLGYNVRPYECFILCILQQNMLFQNIFFTSHLFPPIDSLNTNQFEADSPPSYYSVYTRRPKAYGCAPNSKNILREEDVVEETTADESAVTMNEVFYFFKNHFLSQTVYEKSFVYIANSIGSVYVKYYYVVNGT